MAVGANQSSVNCWQTVIFHRHQWKETYSLMKEYFIFCSGSQRYFLLFIAENCSTIFLIYKLDLEAVSSMKEKIWKK